MIQGGYLMWRRILLTIPALLLGPAAVLIVFVLGYDWHVTAAAMMALIISAMAVVEVWRKKTEPAKANSKRANKVVTMGILGVAVAVGVALNYPKAFEKPLEHMDLLMGSGQRLISAENCAPVPNASSGLDRPFIAPDEAHLESFPIQLNGSIEGLPENERKEVIDSIQFLTFALGKHLSEQDPKAFEGMSESDMAAKTLVKLYRFAQKNSACMTLRKYLDLAEDFKRQKPEWWSEYQAYR
jgi:hypothetical protein